MKIQVEPYTLTPIDSTFKNPICVIKVGTYNDPASEEDLKKVQDFFQSFDKHIIVEYISD